MTPRPTVTNRMSDEELVAAFVGGSQEAFTILVGKYKNQLVNYVWRILGEYDGALDVVQDTFVRLHAKAGTYKPVAKFSTWLYTIASNLARSELRRRKWGFPGRRRDADPAVPERDIADPGELPDDRAGRAIAVEQIEGALKSLPPAFREPVVLFYMEDMSYEEICEILGVRMGTLKSRLSRARAMLERVLRPVMESDESE